MNSKDLIRDKMNVWDLHYALEMAKKETPKGILFTIFVFEIKNFLFANLIIFCKSAQS